MRRTRISGVRGAASLPTSLAGVWRREVPPAGRHLASDIYNLRRSASYRKIRVRMVHTQGSKVSIGERRKPDPKGGQGIFAWTRSIRDNTMESRKCIISTRSYGDAMAGGGLHGDHQRATSDSRVGGDAASISIPDFGVSLRQRVGVSRPQVVKLLNKLLVEEFTKSRAYRSTGQCSGGREERGGGAQADRVRPRSAPSMPSVSKFYAAYFNPYLNFHRPCGYATITT